MIITISGGKSSSDDFDVDPNITVGELLSIFTDAGNRIYQHPSTLALFMQVRNQSKEVKLQNEKTLAENGVMNGDILWLKQG